MFTDTAGLARAMEYFAKLHPHLATPEGAYDQCIAASAAFIDLLLDRGVITRARAGARNWEVLEVDVVNHVSHYAARVGSTIIDWTARQFDPGADWPKVWAADDTTQGRANQ